MQQELLLEILFQNETMFWSTVNRITAENVDMRLNEQAASVGFIYRHVSETMNRFGYFLKIPTTVENTTIGQTDNGQGKDFAVSRALAEQGFEMLRNYINHTPGDAWLEPVETPFFGTVSRMRFLSHILFHNYYHLGQVGLTLAKGGMYEQADLTGK